MADQSREPNGMEHDEVESGTSTRSRRGSDHPILALVPLPALNKLRRLAIASAREERLKEFCGRHPGLMVLAVIAITSCNAANAGYFLSIAQGLAGSNSGPVGKAIASGGLLIFLCGTYFCFSAFMAWIEMQVQEEASSATAMARFHARGAWLPLALFVVAPGLFNAWFSLSFFLGAAGLGMGAMLIYLLATGA